VFKRLTYKTRFWILCGLILVFMIVAWKLAIKKTVDLNKSNNEITGKLENIEDAPIRINLLDKKHDELNQLIGKSINLDSDLHKQLLERVGNYCKNYKITLREFPALHEVDQQDFIIETSNFKMEGGYIKILKLLKLLETEYKIGKVVSVDFYSERNAKTKTKALFARFYIQNIKKKDE